MVSFEKCKDSTIGSFFKGKNETKEEVLNKSKSLVKVFFFKKKIGFLGVLSYNVHSFDVYKKTWLSPSIF